MKIKLDIQFGECECCEEKGNASGEIVFDEFGVITRSSVNSSSFGKTAQGKKKVRQLLKNVAQRVRSEIIN